MHVKSSLIHPEMRVAGALIKLFLPHMSVRKFRLANALLKGAKGKCRSPLTYEQKYISRPDGSLLRLCVYSPLHKQKNVPGLLWFHGGGYAFGIPEQDEFFIRQFVESSGCVVVSPDYRLSIEAPYPAALEDGYASLLWLKENGPNYGMRENQIMVGGDSAGGGLAAALCLYAREKKEVAISFQILLYPMMDDRLDSLSAMDNNAPVCNTDMLRLCWKLYLGEYFGKALVPAYAAPAREKDLSALPPACSYVGSIEPFRDETLVYLNRLREQGIPVHFQMFEGCFHGFDILFPKSSVSEGAMDFLMACFGFATQHYFSSLPPSPERP